MGHPVYIYCIYIHTECPILIDHPLNFSVFDFRKKCFRQKDIAGFQKKHKIDQTIFHRYLEDYLIFFKWNYSDCFMK